MSVASIKKWVGQLNGGPAMLPQKIFNTEDVTLCIWMHFYMWLILLSG